MNHQLHIEVATLTATENPIPPEKIKAALEAILNSKHFAQAPRKRRFVELICEYYLAGRAHELHEYLIGREVYERNDNYNPADDPIVRVGAHDVRKRLEQYYQHEGLHDEVQLEIPVGKYEPVFRYSTPENTLPESSPEGISLPANNQVAVNKHQWKWWSGAIGGGLVIVLFAIWLTQFFDLNLLKIVRTNSTAEQQIYAPVWNPFLKSEDPTILVLSNPAVYVLTNQEDPKRAQQQAIQLSEKQAQKLRESLQAANVKVLDSPNPLSLHLSLTDYTGIGEAISINRLTDLFRSQNLGLTLKQSRNLTAEDLKDRNLIMLGGVSSNVWSGKLLVKEDFYLAPNGTLANRNPQPGEQLEYRTKFDEQTGRILEDYALITVKPASQRKNTMMILEGICGISMGAATDAITGKSYLNEVNRMLKNVSNPKYYQVLLRVGIENQIPTTITPLSVHALNADEF